MILSIDQARRAGWATQQARTQACGTWDLTSKTHAEAMDRLLYLVRQEQPNLIVYEKPIFGSYAARGGTEFKVKLAGAIELAALYVEAKVTSYYPSTVKKWLTGHGRASKQDMITAVAERFGIETEDDNVADAVAMLEMVKAGV